MHELRRLACRAGLLWLAALQAAHGAEPIEVAIYTDDSYPLYSYAVDGMARGVYAAILLKVFARMPDYRVRLVPVPWKRGIKMLEQGEALALAPPYHRPLERPFIEYSAPILTESVVLFCNPAALPKGLASRWPDDYAGLRIGLNSGFLVGGKLFEQARKDGRIIAAEARGTHENIKKLLVGRIDCYMNDRHAIVAALAGVRAETAYRQGVDVVETAVLSQEAGHLGFSKEGKARFPFKDEFLHQFNAALADMKRSGELDQTVEHELHR